MGQLQHLPQELRQLIVEHLQDDRKALLALALTCHTLHTNAARALYYKCTTYIFDTQRKFLRTIVHSQALADLVHIWGFEAYNKPGQELYDLLISGLAAMRNLKQLWFGFDFVGCPSLLRDASFQLNVLRWCGSSESETEFLCDWIKSQPTLTHLHVDLVPGTDAPLKLDGDDNLLPNLIHVRGGNKVLVSLLRRCATIREAVWEVQSTNSRRSISSRALPYFEHLRKLVYCWPLSGYRVHLQDPAAYMVNLEVLEVVGFYHSQSILEDSVSKMTKLRWVIVHLGRELSQEEMARALFQSNSHLRYASIEVCDEGWGFHAHFQHFRRDSGSSFVKLTPPSEILPWYWGLNDDGYLQEGWDGSC